ncbi:MAG: hypothetical protein M3N52_13265 [Actinomycetota bacterium]|nr:hypothetical protein [Actinomycetota bacterium]
MDTIETGDIHFLYRPRVEEEDPGELDDVQNFFVVLRPRGGDRLRLLIVGGKRLPDTGEHERLWGFVQTVASDPEDLREQFRAERYDTRTRGLRHQPAARPAGEGVYAIARRDGETFLAYLLELPDAPGPVQQELQIPPQARYVLNVKDPRVGAPPRAGLPPEQQADFPPRLQERFGDRRWIAADPVDLLDHEGAEILLIGAREDVEVDGTPPLEPDDEVQLLHQLDLDRDEHPVAPLLEGEWD